MVRRFTVSAFDDGNNLALGVQLIFGSASDRTQVEDRRRARRGTVDLPMWRSPKEPAQELAPMVTFTELPPADRILARSVLHPVSSLSPLWGSLNQGSSIIMTLDGEPVGSGTVRWIRPLQPGVQREDITRFVNWSASIPGSDAEE